jgi:hypothetical protein
MHVDYRAVHPAFRVVPMGWLEPEADAYCLVSKVSPQTSHPHLLFMLGDNSPMGWSVLVTPPLG